MEIHKDQCCSQENNRKIILIIKTGRILLSCFAMGFESSSQNQVFSASCTYVSPKKSVSAKSK